MRQLANISCDSIKFDGSSGHHLFFACCANTPQGRAFLWMNYSYYYSFEDIPFSYLGAARYTQHFCSCFFLNVIVRK